MFAFGDASKRNRVRGVPRRYELPVYRYAPRSFDQISLAGRNQGPMFANVVPAPGMPGNELEGTMPIGPAPTPVVQEPPFMVTVPGFTGKSKGGVKAY